MSVCHCFNSLNVQTHFLESQKKKFADFFHNTCKMAKIFKNEMEGESLKYIKYKKYFMQRAKIRAEKNSDQY